jgi:RHS repeat-associated protein
MEDGRGDRYDYDDEGQLTAASYRVATPEGTPGTALRTDVFNYDALGNRMGANRVASRGPVNFARRDNGLNQYLNWTPSAIYYDDNFGAPYVSPGNGVMMAEGWITASFNALNRPMAMWCPTYGSSFLWFGYDPLGRCVKRWMGSATGNAPNSNPATYYYYDGQNMVQEGSSAMFATRIYVHGAGVDQIVASQVSSGEWRYHHYDGQGNCILLTDTSGGIREQYDYDAFGMPYVYSVSGGTLGTGVQWGNRFLFTGREWLQELRIYDYRARQYQPELGRFLQPDPQEFAAGDYNLYRYCHNDPVNRSDPMGLSDNTWDRLMLWQGGGDGTVGEQMNRLDAARGINSPPSDGRVRIEKTRVDSVVVDRTRHDSQEAEVVDDDRFGDHGGKVFEDQRPGNTTGHVYTSDNGTVRPVVSTQYGRYFDAGDGVLKPYGPRWSAKRDSGEPEHQTEISDAMSPERLQARANRAYSQGGVPALRKEMTKAMSEAVRESGKRHDSAVGNHHISVPVQRGIFWGSKPLAYDQ